MQHKTIFDQVLEYLSKVKPVQQVIEDVKFLIDAVKNNPFQYGAIAITALLYFLSPVDAIPDAIPYAGLFDDATVLAAAVAAIRRMMGK